MHVQGLGDFAEKEEEVGSDRNVLRGCREDEAKQASGGQKEMASW